MKTKMHILRILPILLLPMAPASATLDEWLQLDHAEYRKIDDPVFGGEIAVVEAGPKNAPAVVLIHGLGPNASRDWGKVIPALAEDRHVIALDLPGFGRSGKGNHHYSPDRLAQALHGVVSQLTSELVVAVGHSMGGAVALAYTRLYPEQVEQLILVDMAGVLHRSIYTAYLGMQGARWITGDAIDEDSWLGQLVSDVATRIEHASFTPALLLNSPLLRSQILGGDPSTIAAYALVTHDFSAALWEMDTPTLLIWGRQDAVAPLRTGQMAAAVIPGARLEVMDQVGHTPMLEAPEAFNALLLRQLAGRLDTAPYKLAPKTPDNGKTVSCDNRHGRVFSGEIDRLRLRNCRNTLLRNANIGRLEITGGNVHLVNTHIFDGLEAIDSDLRITAGSVRGDPPLMLQNTKVDAAGTAFTGNGHLAANVGALPVTLTFSVSLWKPGSQKRYLHEIVQIPAGGKH